MNTRLITPYTMLTIAIVSAMMCAAGFFFIKPQSGISDFGLVFPSPECWQMTDSLGELINFVIIFICAPLCYLINKTFSLLKSSLPYWGLFYLPLMCANPMASGHITGNVLVLPVTLIMVPVLFSSYKSYNATRSVFFTSTCISVGSMFQQAFLPMFVALVLSCAACQILRFKEFMAMILGLIAPYWVLFGFGVITIDSFHVPDITPIFSAEITPRLFYMLVGYGIMLALTLLLALNNGMKLYAGNAQIRSYNNIINIFGLTAVAAMIFDTNNITAYTGVLNLWVALQFGNLFTLWHLHKAIWIFWLIQLSIVLFSVFILLAP